MSLVTCHLAPVAQELTLLRKKMMEIGQYYHLTNLLGKNILVVSLHNFF